MLRAIAPASTAEPRFWSNACTPLRLDSFAGFQSAGSQLSEQSVISLFRTVCT